MLKQCRWLNEPVRWSLGQDGLRVVTDQATDFWRETYYGFIRHNGHLFGTEVANSFTAPCASVRNTKVSTTKPGL